MTYTIWKHDTKFEWIVWEGENIIGRSGMIFNNYGSAKRAMVKALNNFHRCGTALDKVQS